MNCICIIVYFNDQHSVSFPSIRPPLSTLLFLLKTFSGQVFPLNFHIKTEGGETDYKGERERVSACPNPDLPPPHKLSFFPFLVPFLLCWNLLLLSREQKEVVGIIIRIYFKNIL